MNYKKISAAILTVFILIFICPITALASNNTYSESDIAVLDEILSYGNNSTVLGWDTADPDSITEVLWDLESDNEYHIIEINVSNISITGKMDLRNLAYLEDVYFSNTNIQSVALPSSIYALSNTAFYNCSSLIYAEFNSTALTIGNNTFRNCSNLKSVVNTDCITSIGTNAFNNTGNPTFYGSSTSSYAKTYAATKHFSYSTNYIVSAYCYIGIMTSCGVDYVDLTNSGVPYHTGYLTNQFGTFYADSNGRIDFYTNIGIENTAVIDGATALTRDITFDVLFNNYPIAGNNNAIGIIVCDYNHDGYINGRDLANLITYQCDSSYEEDYCYDFAGDGAITQDDSDYLSEFIGCETSSAYTSWN